ncbi:hypothetical protein CIP107555_01822 [Corynebacterium diphtheriae]|nr:hypothetical protein CIP107555_01822 [Corynebacterium diphtheriae]
MIEVGVFAQTPAFCCHIRGGCQHGFWLVSIRRLSRLRQGGRLRRATRRPSLAHLAKRLSSILQIINHIVFNADSSLVKLDAVADSFTQLIVKQLNRIRGVDDLAGCRRELQKRHEPFPRVTPDLDRPGVFLSQLRICEF